MNVVRHYVFFVQTFSEKNNRTFQLYKVITENNMSMKFINPSDFPEETTDQSIMTRPKFCQTPQLAIDKILCWVWISCPSLWWPKSWRIATKATNPNPKPTNPKPNPNPNPNPNQTFLFNGCATPTIPGVAKHRCGKGRWKECFLGWDDFAALRCGCASTRWGDIDQSETESITGWFHIPAILLG